MAIYSEFSHQKWCFSIATLNYQRVSPGQNLIISPRCAADKPPRRRCRGTPRWAGAADPRRPRNFASAESPMLTTSSYGKCPIYRLFIGDLPIRNGVFFHSYVKLPKGNSIDLSFRATLSLPWWTMTLTPFFWERADKKNMVNYIKSFWLVVQ